MPSSEKKSHLTLKEFSSTTKIAPSLNGQYQEKDELYNPFDHREKKNATSDFNTLAHLIKSSLGSGILAMPYAIKNGGLLFGGIGTIIIGILCTHCVHILVKSSHVLCKRIKTPKMTYSETAHAAFSTGPARLRPFAGAASVIVNIALCSTYIGGTCVYISFISKSMQQVFEINTGISGTPIRLYMLSLLPALILLGQIRNLKILAPISLSANVLLISGLMMTLYYTFRDFKGFASLDNVTLVAHPADMPKFFATVIFAIEGIGVILPLENSMDKPHHFLGCPGVLNVSMTIVVSLYTIVGVFGYMTYQHDAKEIVTLNLPPEEILAQVVKMFIAVAVLLTYGLQFFVPLQIMWQSMRDKFKHKYHTLGETALRMTVVVFTVACACAVPNIGPAINLVGSIFFSFLGIFIPAVIETIASWESHLGFLKWRLWKNIGLVTFSLCALVFGTTVSVSEIIDAYIN